MEYEKNKKRILATQEVCAICGLPVNKQLKYPDPYSATIDHIIPVSRGGHPSDLANLQLAHFKCNRLKSDKLQGEQLNTTNEPQKFNMDDPRGLPLSIDWTKYNQENLDELWNEAEQIRAKGYVITASGTLPRM